jgi:hypothetical protein
MKVRSVLLGLVGAAIGWLEPGSDDMADLVSREGRGTGSVEGEIIGSVAKGYSSQGDHFYTWQPERAEVVAWVAELAPWDHPNRTSQRS